MNQYCEGCENCDCEDMPIKAYTGGQQSLWEKTAQAPSFQGLSEDLQVDVVVIGGGITGLTTAYLLQRAGKKVAVVEAARIGMGVTGYTTAHITEQLDIFFSDLLKRFGHKRARMVADSSRAAIDAIEQVSQELGIAADFERVPGYLYSESAKDVEFLKAEAQAARSLGVDVEFVTDVPLPFRTVGAVKFLRQAQFHPLKYIYGLAQHITQNGGHVFEQTRVHNVKGGRVVTAGGEITGAQVVMATHTPILTRLLPVQGKLSPKRSYVLSGKASEDKHVAAGLFWETKRPYHYMRSYASSEGNMLVVGGEDHPSGTSADTRPYFEGLQRYAHEKFGLEEVHSRWSAQYFNTADDLPYIGKAPLSRNLYVATGFSGTGITFGTVAALLITDLVLGKKHAWEKLYKPSRLSLAALGKLMKFGISNARHVFIDRFKSAAAGQPEDLAVGEGRIMKVDGKKMAVYKDKAGKVSKLSPICTHAGCVVQFNSAEATWDCPCHGSRFTGEGKVLVGPAVEDLKKV
ncbi:MAG: FAD-dependent oxidoreductase [Candidatus Andersenbacteria bacterium]|nr:FAD-dependent oxidoreductase [Candidatus Andersenbacteria bacterium]